MSTYYSFHCKKHQVQGGWYSRQAWGTGNADLIDSFKFVMFHALECGAESIGFHSEYDEQAYWPDTNSPGGPDDDGSTRRQHLEDTAHIWPRSADWKHMEAHPGGDWKEAWQQKQIGELGTW